MTSDEQLPLMPPESGAPAPAEPSEPETAVSPKPKGLATVILDDVGTLEGGMVRQPLDDGSARMALLEREARPPKPARAAGSGGWGRWIALGVIAVLLLAGGGAFALGVFGGGAGTGLVPTAAPSVAASVPASVEPSAVPSESFEPTAVPSGEPTPTEPAVPTATPAPTPTVSAPPGSFVYVVRVGDTLTTLSVQFGVSVDALVAANNLTDRNLIITGQRLIIPAP